MTQVTKETSLQETKIAKIFIVSLIVIIFICIIIYVIKENSNNTQEKPDGLNKGPETDVKPKTEIKESEIKIEENKMEQYIVKVDGVKNYNISVAHSGEYKK